MNTHNTARLLLVAAFAIGCSAVILTIEIMLWRRSPSEIGRDLEAVKAAHAELEKRVFKLSLTLNEGRPPSEGVSRIDADTMSFSSRELGGVFNYPSRWGSAQSVAMLSSAWAYHGGIRLIRFIPPAPEHLPTEEEVSPILKVVEPGSSRMFLPWTDVASESEARKATMVTTSDASLACRSYAALSELHGDCHVDETGAMNLDFVAWEDPLGGEMRSGVVGTAWFLPFGDGEAQYKGVVIVYTMPLDANPHEELTAFRKLFKTPQLIEGVGMIVQSWRALAIES